MEKHNFNEAVAEFVTIRDLLRWATSQFYQANLYYGHGTDNAWDEAVYLVLQALHLPPTIHSSVIDARLTKHEREHIVNLIKRRIEEHMPVAYLTQEAWFAGLPFYVDQRVLIPRSPIAELIEQQFSPWVQQQNVKRVLDLCTGSGCIAVACAMTFPEATIDATDISADALTVARMNVKRHHLEDQIELFQSDLFDMLPPNKYDLIVTNPPYVSTEEMQNLPKEYHHEPALGLAAGRNGLEIVTRILREASEFLTPDGVLIIEVGNSEAALIECFPHAPFTWLEFQRSEGGVFLLTAEQLKHVK